MATEIADAYDYCEFHRRSEPIVYKFDQVQQPDGTPIFARRDKPIWIVRKSSSGWVVVADDPELILSWPINCPPETQPSYPPPGVWRSKKGEKSYLYDLIYPKAVSMQS